MGHGRLAINIELGFIWPPVNLLRFHLYFVFGGLLYSTTGIGVYGELFLLKGQNLWIYFFLATGFHGVHVIVGRVYILISFLRFLKGKINMSHHVGVELAI